MAVPKTSASTRRKSTGLERLPHLAAPLLQFDLESEIRELRQAESWLRGSGRSSKTLVKHPDFRIVLILVKPKAHLQEHKADARISVFTLTGRVRLRLPERAVEVPAGQLLVLDRGIPHDVEALEESAFLLTVSWPRGASHN